MAFFAPGLENQRHQHNRDSRTSSVELVYIPRGEDQWEEEVHYPGVDNPAFQYSPPDYNDYSGHPEQSPPPRYAERTKSNFSRQTSSAPYDKQNESETMPTRRFSRQQSAEQGGEFHIPSKKSLHGDENPNVVVLPEGISGRRGTKILVAGDGGETSSADFIVDAKRGDDLMFQHSSPMFRPATIFVAEDEEAAPKLEPLTTQLCCLFFLMAMLLLIAVVMLFLLSRGVEQRSSEQMTTYLNLTRKQTFLYGKIWSSGSEVRSSDGRAMVRGGVASYAMLTEGDKIPWNKCDNAEILYLWHSGASVKIHTLKEQNETTVAYAVQTLGSRLAAEAGDYSASIAPGAWVAVTMIPRQMQDSSVISVINAPASGRAPCRSASRAALKSYLTQFGEDGLELFDDVVSELAE